MRNCVVNYLLEEAKKDKNVILLTGDLGYGVTDNFEKELPEQFINVGIDEQNMIGVAAGLALTGKKVFCYSIIPFLTMRCYEQIRIDVCCQNLDVNLIGVAGGFAYGTLGNTHYGIEDINVMKGLPNMKILAPADKIEAEVCMKYLFDNKGPFFVRLNRGGEPVVYEQGILLDADIQNGIIVKEGTDITLISIGNILLNVLNAAKILEEKGISTQVISLPLLKPLNKDAILKYISGKRAVFTIEEHTTIGGLGDSIASVIATENLNLIFDKLGIQDVFPDIVGNQDYMRDCAGLSPEKISNTVLSKLQK